MKALLTLKDEKTRLIKLDDLSTESRDAYIAFFTLLFVMGRDTKKVLRHYPELTLSEFPHLIMKNKQGKNVSIYYSVSQSVWIIQYIAGEKEFFNPKAISGTINFLKDFDNDVVISAVEVTNTYIKRLIYLHINAENS